MKSGLPRADRLLHYYSAAAGVGLATFLLLSLPISPFSCAAFGVLEGPGRSTVGSASYAAAAIAAMLTATVLRRLIQQPSSGLMVASSFLAVHISAILWGWIRFTMVVLEPHGGLRGGQWGMLGLLFGGPLIATLSLHVLWPMAFLMVWLLRRIDPKEADLAPEQREILAAIRELNPNGPSRRDPITQERLAEHLGCDIEVVEESLDLLIDRGEVYYSTLLGYQCA